MDRTIHKGGIIGIAALLIFAGISRTALSAEADRSEAAFRETMTRIRQHRRKLLKQWRRAKSRQARLRVVEESRAYVIDAIAEEIFPFWIGTPWTMATIPDGLKPNARTPYDKGRGISCSFFITSVLENAGLRFVNRDAFAGTIAAKAQRAFAPGRKYLRRFSGISPGQLKKRMLKWGEGLYLIGLSCHIGFIVVKGGDVRFVHSSYLGDAVVTDEPLMQSDAIALSEDAGYVVSSLFKDNRLILYWLSGQKLPFEPKRSER